MIFKRTFHPVGQGAFFTEQFYDDNQDTLLYNVVYDCGSKSSGIRKQMERSIRNILHDKKKIDVLFLSHFDDDHVNYVMYLKLNGHLDGTRIFIPMMEAEEWLEIEPYYNNYHLILSLNEQRVGGTKVIKVKFEDSERRASEEPEEVTIEEISRDSISSGTILKPNIPNVGPIWRYTPFNVRFYSLINTFTTQLRQNGLYYDQLGNRVYVLQHMGELKKIYQGLGKKPTGGTAINLNSLLVMSYPVKPEQCKEYGNSTTCRMYFYEWYRWNERFTKYWFTTNKLYAGSCLYTGDTSANDPTVWNKIGDMISRRLNQNNRLTLMQVPHHGSKHSYDAKLVDSDRYYAGFTNYDPFYRQRIFDDNLPMKFAMRKKPLILVTREYGSKFEEYWRLMV